MQLIPAIKKDQALVEEMDAQLGDGENFYIWWLGQSGFLLQWNQQRAVIDPYLSDTLTVKYATTNRPHIRMSERVIDPELLRNISVVSSSHNHTDHLDAATLLPIINNNPGIKFIIPEANREFVADRLKCEDEFPIGLNDRKSVTVGNFTFHGIPAKHNEIERDATGCCKYMGYVIEFGKWRVYHSGDTLWFPDMADLLRPYSVNLALLPINGNDPARGVAGNLDYKEAPALAKAIGAGMVIPCHYNMFSFNTADVDDFVKEAQSIEQPFTVLEHGGMWSSSQLR